MKNTTYVQIDLFNAHSDTEREVTLCVMFDSENTMQCIYIEAMKILSKEIEKLGALVSISEESV